jgi:hypothetical protein
MLAGKQEQVECCMLSGKQENIECNPAEAKSC